MKAPGPRSFFWVAGPMRALAETCLIAVVLLFLLQVDTRVASRVVWQGVFFLGPVCALWYALRLRLPAGSWRRHVRFESLWAIALSALLAALSATIAGLPSADRPFAGTPPAGMAGGLLIVLFLSGTACLVFRAGVRLWRLWDGLRRHRMVWGLTHALLSVAVVIAALAVALVTFLAAVSYAGDTGGETWYSLSLAALFSTILPILSLLVILTLLALAGLLLPSALFSYLVARATTRRLAALAFAARALRSGDYAARVAVRGEDEVAQLQADFNAMAEELQHNLLALEAERDRGAALLQSRRQLIASVSHELRTPIATLRGYLEPALASWDEAPPPSLHHDLAIMDREVARLQGLIEDLFTLARAEEGGLALTLAPTNVAEVAAQVVDAWAPLAWQSGRVEVVMAGPLGDTPPVLIDASRLQQILVNLIRNGVRHTPPGGIVAVGLSAADGWMALEVRDTGEGISPADLPRVFERFYRGDSGRQGDGTGAGLGLALVKELTEAMGGDVSVESCEGQGSCFMVRLPIYKGPSEARISD